MSQPRLFNVIDRHRLFTLLDEERDNRPVVWIAGPPGAGKTALAASYVKARDLPVIWYQVDGGDTDIATFFYYLAQAGRKAAGNRRLVLPLLTPEYLPDLPGFTRRFFRTLFAVIPATTILVLDNYQEAVPESVFHVVIQGAVAEFPAGISLLAISRTDPPPQFARMIASNLIGRIGWEDLRLTSDEIRAIATMAGQILDEKAMQSLREQANGWAAGLVLMIERLKQTGIVSPASRSETMELVFDYFASEMFDQAPLAMRQFLIRTAILPHMTLKMAIEMSGNPRAKEMLDYLYRHRLFIDRRANGEVIYQYHALFREFLLDRIGDYFSTRGSRSILQLGAILMERNGDTGAAAELFAKAQAWEDLTRLLNSHAAVLLTQGRHQTLQQMIGFFPQQVIDTTPWIIYWRGVSNILFNTHMARSDIEQAYAGFQNAGDSTGLFLSCSAMMEVYLYAEDDMTPVVIWGERLQQLLNDYGDFPSIEIEIRVFANLLGLVFAAPHHPLLEILETRFENVLRSTTEPSLRIAVASAIIYLPLWRGEAGKVRRIIDEIAPLLDHPSVPPLLHILWRNIEGAYAWSITASSHIAEQKFREALQIAQESGISILNNIMWAHCAYSALSAGNITGAQAYLEQLESNLSVQRKHDLTEFCYLRAGIEFLKGNFSQALDDAMAALRLHEETGRLFLRELSRLGLAQILIETGNTKAARDHLGITTSYALAMKNTALKYRCLLIKAYSWLKEGNDAKALIPLQEGLRIGRENDFLLPSYWGHPQVMASLFTLALQSKVETVYVQSLIRQYHIKAESPDIENWPWPVRIYTFGRFSVLCNDTPLRFEGKAQRKPLELLKYLCALGGRAVSQDRIMDALWPDSSGDDAGQVLRTTLHRLRKLLQHERAIRLENRQLSLDTGYVWVDYIAFYRVAHLPDATQASLQMAVSRYQGRFLAGESEPWILSFRERLHLHYLNMSEQLGLLLERNDNWTAAARHYLRAIEIEPVAEIFYRRLMICYTRLGRRARALSTYQRCRHTLLSHLGTSPSQETQLLYQALIAPGTPDDLNTLV